MRRAFWLGLTLIFGPLACSGSRASIEIEDARVSYVDYPKSKRVNIDLDVLAHDQLGGSIGQYCFQVAIPFQDTQHYCDDDLSDGDRKTVRITTPGDCADALAISVTLRNAGTNIGRDVIAPTAPKNP